ncbi:MAG: MATE family efflux transporter [Thermoanaerobaculia bacterium]
MSRAANIAELKAMVRLAVPLAAAQAGSHLMGVVDAAVVGRLSPEALAAVGLGNSIFFAVAVIAMGVVTGIDPLASQAIGAREPVRARRYLWQGVWLAIGTSLFFMLPLLATPWFIRAVGIGGYTGHEAGTYVVVRSLSLMPTLIFFVVRAYLQANGITRPMVVSIVAANLFNLGADIVFVFGGTVLPPWTGPLRAIPAMGVTGAAVATVLGSILQLGILLLGVEHFESDVPMRKLRRFIREDVMKALRIGLPIGLQWGAEVGLFSLVGVLAGRLGNDAMAAHQVAITLAALTFAVAVGIGVAGSVRVGRAIGARDAAGTRRAGLVAFTSGAVYMVFSGAMFFFFPEALARLLSDHPRVIAVSAPLLVVAAVFQISDGVQAVGAGVLRGAGDTRYAFIVNVIGHWAIGLPIALLLGFKFEMGITGLWWGLCAGLTSVALMLFFRFVRTSRTAIAPI